MVKIGDFAKMFNITVKSIRFYEEKGLITPAFVDIYSGYRYYDEQNIKDMSKILFLKKLGYKINEIKHYDEENLDDKIIEYENRIKELYKSINILKSLSKRKGGIIMKAFINDPNAIGKWKFIGLSNSVEDYKKGKQLNLDDKENDDIFIKELYLLENGQEYWVISWTKGFIYINDQECPYEIKDNLLYLKYFSPINKEDFKILVFEKVDSKAYTIEEIKHKDETDIPFIEDKKLIGFWETVDIVNNKESFNPDKKFWEGDFTLTKLTISPDTNVIVNYSDFIKTTKYSKPYIIDLVGSDTLSKYEIKNINNSEYLILEWKSGDYTYGKFISCYYVLKKIS